MGDVMQVGTIIEEMKPRADALAPLCDRFSQLAADFDNERRASKGRLFARPRCSQQLWRLYRWARSLNDLMRSEKSLAHVGQYLWCDFTSVWAEVLW